MLDHSSIGSVGAGSGGNGAECVLLFSPLFMAASADSFTVDESASVRSTTYQCFYGYNLNDGIG